jgi:polyisoprenyl-teichoic acid--peptidoglycan teichoic acid transferase
MAVNFSLFLLFFLFYLSCVYGLLIRMVTNKISPVNEGKNILWPTDLRGEKSGNINLLLLGIRGDKEAKPYITNAMMVLDFDIETKKTNLISIPRNLLLPIPKHGQKR